MLHRITLPVCLLYTLLVLAAACGTHPSTPDDSRTVALSIAGTAEPGAVDPAAVAAAYSQRLRLGLGSPYRLIETALGDDRLGEARAAVARGLLTQIERGGLYEVTPLALVAAGVPQANAIAQLELIRHAIEGTPDPRVGELAVKLAYELAVAEETVAPELVARVARVAALLRDRQLAIRDGHRLRDAARRHAAAQEELVPLWRSQRTFAVEQPTLAPLDPAAQEEAARLALLLVGGIRSAVTPVANSLQRTVADVPSQLHADAAAHLAQDTTTRRPQNALLITLRAIRAASEKTRSHLKSDHWQEFFDRAVDEESFVVQLARARQSPADDVAAAALALDAAIALRPFAQQQVGPADAPSVQDLQARFGVRVSFDTRVSEAERTRTLRMLARSLEDLRSVIRTIDLTGLAFRVAPLEPTATHLAYHEPRRRVIHLDPATAAGTIAHEVAHDLDWQLATRKYRTRSNYATDFATQNHRTLAYAVQNLVPTAAPMPKPSPDDPGARRPAEIFARRFEWYVASALAQQGRSNGFLSSAQDDWIPGYGAAVRPDASATAAKSFASILADATSMDRGDAALVERIIKETTPVVVRVLGRADRASDQASFERQALADIAEWECGSAWQARIAVPGTSLRWFVQALGQAVYQPMLSLLVPPDPFQQHFSALDAVRASGSRNGSCATLVGAVLANPF